MAKAIPDGYGTVTPFLNVKGAKDAIELYKRALGAEVRTLMPGPNDTIMHCEMKIGSSMIMLGDAIMNAPTQSSCHLFVEDADAWWKRATDAGMQVAMPIGDMFWGDRYGVLTDRFGNRWSIATHKEDVPPAEMSKRAVEAVKQMQAQTPQK